VASVFVSEPTFIASCCGFSQVKDFKAALANGAGDFPELLELAEEVRTFARSFPTVGF